jgi:N-acetyl sugar amidotransferase
MNERPYQMCTRCIMDTTDPDIVFDEQGVCSHCHRYIRLLPSRVHRGPTAKAELDKLVARIRAAGRGREYDCIIGVSGGVDSTYVAYLTKELGLRPLAVHFDNGWNSALAVTNIEKTLDKLGIDLYTYVIDWEMFKDLQLAFLKASTPDGEIPTDHAIFALLWQEASRRGIRYVLNGVNFATESLSVPAWAYGHFDWRYVKGVHRKFGTVPLKKYPHFSLPKLAYYTAVRGIKVVSILNYIDYNRDNVMDILVNQLGWVYYGGKHYESVYTRFFQAYILPQKYKIDKRRGHLSDLVSAGQMIREEALNIMTQPVADAQLLEQDRQFVIKKFQLKEEQFEELMHLPNRTFRDYSNNDALIRRIKRLVTILRRTGLYSK